MNSKSEDDNRIFFIRADMNCVIATGHMMRCLSIADAISKRGGRVIFISADSEPEKLVKSRGYEIEILGSDWNDMEAEIPKLATILERYSNKVMLVDTYQVTEKYFSEIKKYVKAIYIDDLKAGAFDVHTIVSYAVYAGDLDYPAFYKEKNLEPNFCLGLDYTPLRDMFVDCPAKAINSKIEKILVMSGGTDTCNMLDKFTAALAQKGYELTVICGRLNPNRETLRRKYDEKNVTILDSVDNMKDYINDADVVITAGGTTLYELCAVGTPAITFSFADNQLLNVAGFDSRGIMYCAGDARCDDVVGKTLELLAKYEDVSVRQKMSVLQRNTVDGHGADRIAEIMYEA